MAGTNPAVVLRPLFHLKACDRLVALSSPVVSAVWTAEIAKSRKEAIPKPFLAGILERKKFSNFWNADLE